MTNELNYVRGAFIAYEPDGYPKEKRVIPFRFNPEALVAHGRRRGGTERQAASRARPRAPPPRRPARRAPTRPRAR